MKVRLQMLTMPSNSADQLTKMISTWRMRSKSMKEWELQCSSKRTSWSVTLLSTTCSGQGRLQELLVTTMCQGELEITWGLTRWEIRWFWEVNNTTPNLYTCLGLNHLDLKTSRSLWSIPTTQRRRSRHRWTGETSGTTTNGKNEDVSPRTSPRSSKQFGTTSCGRLLSEAPWEMSENSLTSIVARPSSRTTDSWQPWSSTLPRISSKLAYEHALRRNRCYWLWLRTLMTSNK